MNFEYAAGTISERTASIQRDLANLRSKLTRADKKTSELLEIAREVGVTVVSVGMHHPLVDNDTWKYNPSGSIFTPPDQRVNNWPAAWHIAEASGVGYGCGNVGQHQADTSDLVDGVYELRGGMWARVDLIEGDTNV